MRTTVTLDDDLLGEVKVLAARTHRTIGSVLEEALREYLADVEDRAARARATFCLPVIDHGEWVVDIHDNAAVQAALDASALADVRRAQQ